MPSLEEVTCNREECIAAVRDYYHFLTKLYLDESDIEEPPEDGWPNITADTMRGLGKTDEVVQLLRHLPYIRSDERVQGGPWVEFANWRETAGEHGIVSDEEGESARVCSEPPEYVDNIPPQVISITSNESELGGIFLLDTERGIVHWYGCYGELKDSEGAIEDDPCMTGRQKTRRNGERRLLPGPCLTFSSCSRTSSTGWTLSQSTRRPCMMSTPNQGPVGKGILPWCRRSIASTDGRICKSSAKRSAWRQ